MIDARDLYISDLTNNATEIITHVTETQEAFIFQTISDFTSSNYQIIIEKEELIRAISLIRMSREHGPGIDVRWETATQQCAVLDEAYMRGFRDGVNKEHARIMDILEGE